MRTLNELPIDEVRKRIIKDSAREDIKTYEESREQGKDVDTVIAYIKYKFNIGE